VTRALRASEKRAIALLGLPTLALALTSTVVTTYSPVVARELISSTTVIGLIIGMEGFIALWLPLIVGAWSDRLDTRVGGRLPFLLGATPAVILGLAGLALAGSAAILVLAGLLFFLGYFVAYEPYRALYPDAVGDRAAGRAQANQAVWRGIGTGLALIGGGVLLDLGQAAPFVAGAGVYVLCLAVFAWVLLRRGVPHNPNASEHDIRGDLRELLVLVRGNRPLQAFLAANALWELSLAALKTFVVLYVTVGLGFAQATGSLLIGGAAVVIVLAALVSGRLADRYGTVRVMMIALPIHGLGFLIPLLSDSHVLVALALPFVAIGGGVIMALPYALLIPLMPDGERGALTGYYSFSRGLGTWLGPLLGGAAIGLCHGLFEGTDGYQAVWGVCAVATLLSLLPLRILKRTGVARRWSA
jgi:MFS family permease